MTGGAHWAQIAVTPPLTPRRYATGSLQSIVDPPRIQQDQLKLVAKPPVGLMGFQGVTTYQQRGNQSETGAQNDKVGEAGGDARKAAS